MDKQHHQCAHRIATICSLPIPGVTATLSLFAAGGTVPFIARYRKESTGNLTEGQIEQIRDEFQRLEALEQRRGSIANSLRQQGIQDPELFTALDAAATMGELEDLYVPYRRKRVTRADKARAAGYGPLAEEILSRGNADPYSLAANYANPTAALAGAADIIAEQLHQYAPLRRKLRVLFRRESFVTSVLKRSALPEAARIYQDYHDWTEPARGVAAHRLMAMLRGAQQEVLNVHVRPPETAALAVVYQHGVAALEHRTIPPTSGRRRFIEAVATDAYRRLLGPSLETEYLGELRETAHREAVEIFALNLRTLLEAPPMGEVPVLAIDPGFRGGCKWVALGPQGQVEEHGVMYPLPPHKQTTAAEAMIADVIARQAPVVIALGDGTGSREAETFLRAVVTIPIVLVREAGASIYSASPLARKELPHLDVTIRGAVSIGRRLMDPLAELVKIDPAAIGVGQYQHDVEPRLLESKLIDALQSCVNARGVQLNTASRELLQHVAGLSVRTASAIVAYREAHGPFRHRGELCNVPGIGAVTFQQSSGFLRISGGLQPLDATGIHPEHYAVAEALMRDATHPGRRCQEDELLHYVQGDVGLPTLRDICRELTEMNQPPPPIPPLVTFDPQVHNPDDLKEGMVLPGRVTNVTGFGTFVDIGVHLDGLIHASRLCRTLRIYETVSVVVVAVDLHRGRISLDLCGC